MPEAIICIFPPCGKLSRGGSILSQHLGECALEGEHVCGRVANFFGNHANPGLAGNPAHRAHAPGFGKANAGNHLDACGSDCSNVSEWCFVGFPKAARRTSDCVALQANSRGKPLIPLNEFVVLRFRHYLLQFLFKVLVELVERFQQLFVAVQVEVLSRFHCAILLEHARLPERIKALFT